MTDSRWTPDLVAELRMRWERGDTAIPIAAALGNGITRNMVIAKAHQLDLHARRT